MKDYYKDFMNLCHKSIDDMSFSNYYQNVCKCFVICFNHLPISAISEAAYSLDTIRDFYDKKETIYDCCIEVGIENICG